MYLKHTLMLRYLYISSAFEQVNHYNAKDIRFDIFSFGLIERISFKFKIWEVPLIAYI
jgi:hypothetical protein